MKHRDRVSMALNHEAPDRCPMQVSFTPEFADRLRADLQLKGQKVHNPHGGGNTYELERALDEDMLLDLGGLGQLVLPGGRDLHRRVGHHAGKSQPYDDAVRHRPLHRNDRASAGGRRGDCELHWPPDPNRPELYDEAARVIRDFKDEYWIVGVTVTTIFETAWALRGYEQMLMDFVANPDLAEHILNIPYQYHLTAAKKLVEMGVDMIWIGDDVGMQTGMLISPKTWRKFLKPRWRISSRRSRRSTRRSRWPITRTATSPPSSPT